MAVSCDPNSLAQAATAARMCCLSPATHIEVQTYLLQQMAIVLLGSAIPTDPSALAQTAKAFQTLSSTTQLEVQTYLLCQIAAVSGV